MLGVKRTASQREIKQAYLKASLKWHPETVLQIGVMQGDKTVC